tara:strand:- start:1153 stop:3033 length:1881 start_codon:yes stop_codon:yes gene_type:complete
MCGIAGVYNFNNKKVNSRLLKKITEKLSHRGPDSCGTKLIDNVGLGHRRLSILDLSINGNQPMKSNSNHLHIVYNGEVYNFLEIKEDLIKKKYKFLSESDTEVILNSYIEYGKNCFSKFNGMFSIAIYNSEEKELVIARDPLGIKPLYYYQNKNFFCFASEIKSIKSHPEVMISLSKQGFVEYLWYGNQLGENTIYNEIKELKPGTYKSIKINNITDKVFFSINKIREIKITEKQAIYQVKNLLEESVKRHLVSDVDVGVFLSGGVDSSAITAFASKHYSGKLKTYSVGFDFDNGNNELEKAKKIAKLFNTDHHEIIIKGVDIIEIIENLVYYHDGPFADAADIPLFLLTKKLKGKVKVILQGDGGDEIFGGYSRYTSIYNANFWSLFSFIPKTIEHLKTKNKFLIKIQRFISAITNKNMHERYALLLTMDSYYFNTFQLLNKKWKEKLKNFDPFKRYKNLYNEISKNNDELQSMFFIDTQIVLKDTFFEKVDKSTMANSIEVRVPFVDKVLSELVLSIPSNIKVKNGKKKYLLKKSLENIIPNDILYAKKKGFGVPYHEWLKYSLKNYFLLNINSKKFRIFFDTKKIKKMYYSHLDGKGNYGFILWKLLIFSVWINKSKKINIDE